MTATMTSNGDGRDVEALARADAVAGMSRPEIAAKYGWSTGKAGRIRREAGVTVRNGAPVAVPPVAADSPGEAAPVARSKAKVPRRVKPDRGTVDWLVIAIVGVVVALVSYSHIVDLAVLAGHGWRAYLAPIALDGLAIAAIRAWQVGQHRRVAAVGIAVGIVGSVAANVLAVRPELVDLADVSAVLAAFPPIALAVIVHLVRR
jgi:hypothetical protein